MKIKSILWSIPGVSCLAILYFCISTHYLSAASASWGNPFGTTGLIGTVYSATTAITNSQASAIAKQNAIGAVNQIIALANAHPEPALLPPNGTSSASYQVTVGFANAHVRIFHWMVEDDGGGTIPWKPNSVEQPNATVRIGGSHEVEGSQQSSIAPLAGIKPPRWVVCSSYTFSVSWPDASAPTLTISPNNNQTISIGDSITFTSVATHNENELIKHNFEWKSPDSGQWSKDIPGFNGAATVHDSGTLNVAPHSEFSGTTQKTRTVIFTPLIQGRYVFRYAAADKVAGFAYSQEIAVMVENAAPHQTLDAPSSVHVGSTPFSLIYTANNPTALSNYMIGFRLLEQREDLNGNIYQPWEELGSHALAAGNRSFTGARPAPGQPGIIRYRAYAWNQWMIDAGAVIERTVQVPNRAPTIAWENPPVSFEYGQPVIIRARAQDPDNNLAAIHMDLNEAPHRHDGFTGGLTGNPSNAFLESYPIKHGAGTYTYAAVATDGWATSARISHAVTVTKATPLGSFSSQSLREGAPLTVVRLSARFANPHDGSDATASNAITYRIISGGNASHPDGSEVNAATVLPSGAYTIRATLAASQNYNEASTDAQFVVESDPDADNDGDGLSNAIETALGLNPNSPATNSPEIMDVNIHTPTLENQ